MLLNKKRSGLKNNVRSDQPFAAPDLYKSDKGTFNRLTAPFCGPKKIPTDILIETPFIGFLAETSPLFAIKK